jgi:Ni/Co efflux regulator RcnB
METIMRKFVILAALAATVLPVAAQAQTREIRRDRQELREERRDLRQAQRDGDRRDIRRERRDVRDARRELREDRRDYRQGEWRGYRNSNRAIYRRGNWRSPYRYTAFRPGITIGRGYYAPRYYINDWYRYRLPRPGNNLRWVRHYDDVLLINIRTGRIVDVQRGFYW